VQGSDLTNICPRCGSSGLKRWDELDDEQKFLVERLPGSADSQPKERKKHRFCVRCWFEEMVESNEMA